MATTLIDAALDVAVGERVRLHREREAGELSVDAYLEGLRRVRQVEDQLEPVRVQLGARASRALELVATQDDVMGERARAYLAELA